MFAGTISLVLKVLISTQTARHTSTHSIEMLLPSICCSISLLLCTLLPYSTVPIVGLLFSQILSSSVPLSQCAALSQFDADSLQQTEGNMHCKATHNRFMTVFVYLNDVDRGGCTAFPQIGIHYGLDKASFYDKPGPFNCTEDHEGNKPYSTSRTQKKFCEPTLRIAPKR